MKKYISYYRVSTMQQGNSGLGLEAQRTLVRSFIGSNGILIKEYEEIESGKKNDRPQLLTAIEHCKREGLTLLIAKLDRLSRNASFIFMLRNSKVDFVCTDMPEANSVTIGIMAVLAQDERERTSRRTREALAELKRQGKKLGSPQNLNSESRMKAVASNINKALNNTNNRKATAMIISLRKDNLSYRQIANQLNSNGFLTSTGKNFSGAQVLMLYKRYCNNLIIV